MAATWSPLSLLVFEPGRSIVSRAGVTLYSVGGVKQTSAATTFVTIDGGMSDNPRPAMYGARYTALLANRADETIAGAYAVAGKHCESSDVLIERVELPEPRRGDVLAVPVTGAYTLSMSSNYNAVTRPPAVLVADGQARLIRRRESIDDLFAFELITDFEPVIEETISFTPCPTIATSGVRYAHESVAEEGRSRAARSPRYQVRCTRRSAAWARKERRVSETRTVSSAPGSSGRRELQDAPGRARGKARGRGSCT